MPREIKPDGDLRFEGFASYPNSSAFPPDAGMLEYSENMELVEGVATPRQGSTLSGTASGPVTYACSAASSNGDSILLWGANQRFNCQSGVFTSVNLAAKQKARGQGYQDAITMETTDTDFVAGANIIERLVTAKGDKLNFTLYTGVQPYEPDHAYLIQGTYDQIQAIEAETNSMLVFGKRSIYQITAGTGRQANFNRMPSPQVFHRIIRLSKNDGLAAKDGVCRVGQRVLFMDSDGIKMAGFTLDLQGRAEYQDGTPPMSEAVNDLIGLIDPSKFSDITAASCHGRAYFSLPLLGQYNKSVILAINPYSKTPFESVYVYPYSIDTLVTGRKDGKVRLWGVNKASGKIYLLNEGSTDDGSAIVAKIRSRSYMFQSHSEKKYDDCFLSLDTKGHAEVEMNFISVNPDGKWLMDKFSANLGTAVRRALTNKKSMSGKLEIVVKSGRPYIYSIGLEASIVGKSIFSSF
jgi:hypothetical protein